MVAFLKQCWPFVVVACLLCMSPICDGTAISQERNSRSVASDNKNHDHLGTSLLVVGRLVDLQKEVKTVYLLLETKYGALKVYQADRMFLGRDIGNKEESSRYYLTSVFPKSDINSPETIIRSSFLVLYDHQGGSESTKELLPVSRSNIWDLEAQSRGISAYVEENEQLHGDLRGRLAMLDEIKRDSDVLAGKVGDSPKVREAAELKREVSALSYAQDDLGTRLDMLQGMITGSGSESSDEQLELRQAELSEQLKNVAQITARADRLNRLKKLAYANSIKRKMSIIEEFGGVDPSELEQELSELRARRANLEERIGTAPAASVHENQPSKQENNWNIGW